MAAMTDELHSFMPQPGCNFCICGMPADDPHHPRGRVPEDLAEALLASLLANPHVQDRLDGAPHQHHQGCIHNLTPDQQIAARGRTREWWEAMGLSIPVQITPAEWRAKR
jgi:hypothetical protein